MGFLDSVITPNQATPAVPKATGGTGFLSSVVMPDAEATKIAGLNTQAEQAKQAAAAAQPTIGSVARGAMTDIADHVKSYAQESTAIVPKFGDALLHPINTLSRIGNKVIGAEQAGVQQAGEGLLQTVQEPGAANKVAGVAKIISGLAGAAFSPVTGVFDVAEATPGLKQVADTINIPFTTTGKFGSWLTGSVIDGISNKYPGVLPPESRDIIKAPLQAVGSLAGQILLGGKIMEGVNEFASRGHVITPEVAKGIVVKAHDELGKVADPAPVASPAVPTAMSTPETPNAVKNGFLDSVTQPEKAPVATEVQPIESQAPVAVEGQKPSGIAKSIEVKAIEAKLTKGFDTVAGYDPLTFKDQAEKAANLIDSGIDNARAVVRGETPLPDGLRGTALIAGMEEYLKNNPDPDIAHELANSHLVSANSASAQELGLSRMREADSATAALQEIKKAKEAQVDSAEVPKARKSLNIESKKVNLSKEELSWDNFLEQIKC